MASAKGKRKRMGESPTFADTLQEGCGNGEARPENDGPSWANQRGNVGVWRAHGIAAQGACGIF
jgi:hypothetical protein